MAKVDVYCRYCHTLEYVKGHGKGTRKIACPFIAFNIRFYCMDDYAVYDSLSEEEHLTGKTFTQRLERNNLTHRTRIKRLNRKTIEYSKSAGMYDKVIGTFIERENYF
ncbi:IS1 family transposase [Xenorhabdus bovienii]|nr:IS1 family transposase [Xenorhabdus bovienii]